MRLSGTSETWNSAALAPSLSNHKQVRTLDFSLTVGILPLIVAVSHLRQRLAATSLDGRGLSNVRYISACRSRRRRLTRFGPLCCGISPADQAPDPVSRRFGPNENGIGSATTGFAATRCSWQLQAWRTSLARGPTTSGASSFRSPPSPRTRVTRSCSDEARRMPPVTRVSEATRGIACDPHIQSTPHHTAEDSDFRTFA